MYLEVKAMLSIIAMCTMAIVIGLIMLEIPLLGVMLFISLGLFVFGDIFLGIKIMNSKAYLWFEPLKQGEEEICVIQTSTGLLDLVRLTKDAYGIRYGVYHKRRISIINEGDQQFFTRNGNIGFFAHENYDKNVNILECKALEKLDGDNIKDIRLRLLKKPKQSTRERIKSNLKQNMKKKR